MLVAIIALYSAVACLCLFAARAVGGAGRPAAETWQWTLIAAWFGVLIVIRLLDIEDTVREALRETFRSEGLYAGRRIWQGPLVDATLVVAGVLGWLALLRWPGRQSRVRLALYVARLAALGYVPLYVLRLVSLHAVDKLLYASPIRLNWLIDGGLALAAGGAAAVCMAEIRRRRGPAPAGRR